MPDEHVNAQSTHIQKWSFCRDLLPRGLEIDVSHTHTHTHTHKVTPLYTSKVTSRAILDLSNARQLSRSHPNVTSGQRAELAWALRFGVNHLRLTGK